jgi:SLT domain-containing protein/phage-related protein
VSTVTKLGFTIDSKYDDTGMRKAQADVQKFSEQLRRLDQRHIRAKVDADVEPNFVADFQAKLDQRSRASNYHVNVKVKLDDDGFEEEVRRILDDRTFDVRARLDSAAMEAELQRVEREHEVRMRAVADTVRAEQHLDHAARDRVSSVTMSVDGSTNISDSFNDITTKMGGMGRGARMAGIALAALAGALYLLPPALGVAGAAMSVMLPAALGGIALSILAENEQIKAAGKELKKTFEDILVGSGMKESLLGAISTLRSELQGMAPDLQAVFGAAGQHLTPLVKGLMGLVREALPGLKNSLNEMGPVMWGFRDGMSSLGRGIGEMFDKMTDGAGGLGKIWRVLGDGLGDVLSKIGEMIGKLADAGGDSLKSFFSNLVIVLDSLMKALIPLTQESSGGFSVFGSLLKGIAKILEIIGPSLGRFTETLGRVLDPILNTLANTIGRLLDSGLRVLGPLLDALAPYATQLAESLGGVLVDVIGVLADGLIAFMPTLKQMSEIWADMIRQITPALRDSLMKIVQALVEALQKLAPEMPKLVKSIADLVIALVPVIPKLTELAIQVIPVLTDALIMFMPYIIGMINAFTSFVTFVMPAMLDGLTKMAEAVGWVADKFSGLTDRLDPEFLRGRFSQMRDDIGNIGGQIGENWRNFLDGMLNGLRHWGGSISEIWSSFWNSLKDYVSGVWMTIQAYWDLFWVNVGMRWDAFKNGMSESWNGFWNGIKDFVAQMWQNIQTIWSIFWDGIGNRWDAFRNGMAASWSIFWEGIKAVGKGIWDRITGAFNDFKGGVEAILDGLVKKAGEIWDKLRGVFARPINAVIGFWNDTIADKIGMGDKKIPKIPGFATGGYVTGPGTGTSDSIPARLSNGEFVVQERYARNPHNRAILDTMNRGGEVPGFANGGPVEWMSGWAAEKVPGTTVSSSYRTTPDYHGQGKAVDLVNSLPNMMRLAGEIASSWGGKSLELIHGNGFGGNVKNGQNVGDGMSFYGASTMAGHNDHVHWASDRAMDEKDRGGIGGFISGMVGQVRELVSGIFSRMSDPIINAIPDPFVENMGAPMGGAAKGFATVARDNILELIKEKEPKGGGFGSDFGPGALGQVPTGERRDLILKALGLSGGVGVDTENDWLVGMNTLIQRESGWDPGAINLTDSNAAKGTPSKGLAQMIDPTFQAYKIPGHEDIWNPLDNVAASTNYIKKTKGSIRSVQQAFGATPMGYRDGTENAKEGWNLVGENGPEMMNTPGGAAIHSFDDIVNALQTGGNPGQMMAENVAQGDWAARGTGILTDFGKTTFDSFFTDLTGGGYESGAVGSGVKAFMEYGKTFNDDRTKRLEEKERAIQKKNSEQEKKSASPDTSAEKFDFANANQDRGRGSDITINVNSAEEGVRAAKLAQREKAMGFLD